MKYIFLIFSVFYFSACMPHATPKPTPVVEANSTKQMDFLRDIVKEDILAVKSSLDNGMNPNIQKKDISAIELATRENSYEMVKLLLEYGANPLEKMSSTYLDISVAAFSASNEDSRILKLMFEYGANSNNLNNFSAFSGAVSKNREENFNFLLENGFDVNATRRQKDSILSYCASEPSRVKMTKALLVHGADVNAQTDNNVTALLNAILLGNRENVALLLEYGADVNHQDANGNNAVARAVKFDNVEVLKVLIKYNADITSKLHGKVTPLIVACVLNNYRVAKVLVDSMKVKDSGYILIAYKYSDSKMFNFLLDNGFVLSNVKLGKSFINFYLANDRDKELKEYLNIYATDGFELRFISLKAKKRVSAIFDALLKKNNLTDTQKLNIAKNFQYSLDTKRAYEWMMSTSSKKPNDDFKCIISANVAKTDIEACKSFALDLQKKKQDSKLSFTYLLLKEYDKSINAAKKSLIKEKKYYVYSNMGHSYLLKGQKKSAYKAYKKYFYKLNSPDSLSQIKEDFNMLKLNYPNKVNELNAAYKYCKKIDLEVMKKFIKAYK